MNDTHNERFSNDEQLLTINELCHKLRISKSTEWRMRQKGMIPYADIDGKIRYTPENVDAFISEKTIDSRLHNIVIGE